MLRSSPPMRGGFEIKRSPSPFFSATLAVLSVRIARIKQNFLRVSSLRPSRLCGEIAFSCPQVSCPLSVSIREAHEFASLVLFCSHLWLSRFRLRLCLAASLRLIRHRQR